MHFCFASQTSRFKPQHRQENRPANKHNKKHLCSVQGTQTPPEGCPKFLQKICKFLSVDSSVSILVLCSAPGSSKGPQDAKVGAKCKVGAPKMLRSVCRNGKNLKS